jgi:hypothetical protein
MEEKTNQPNQAQIVYNLWKRGILIYKLKPIQKELYQRWLESKAKSRKFACVGTRRGGKSTVGFIACLEEAIKFPGSNILFVVPVLKNIDRYVSEIASKVLTDCPTSLRPEYFPQKTIYKFANGSQIFCVGSSNQSYENLRGARINLAVIDEAQRNDDLEIIVDEVVIPSLMDSDGRMMIYGTVPRQPNHPFIRRYAKDAKDLGAYFEFTIYQCWYPPERIAEFRKEVSKEAWEREFECKANADKKFTVTPNFDPANHIKRVPDPSYFPSCVSYTSMDIGGALDNTHIPFAYFDSVRKKLVVKSESVWAAQESRVDKIAKAIKDNERHLSKKVRRVCDTNNFILVKELLDKHKIVFDPVQKGPGSLEAMLEILNIWIESDRILVDPSCKVLIHELKYGSWNKTRTEFDRREGSHCDGLIALAYMLTIVNERHKINASPEEDTKFVPPPKDPLNLKETKMEVPKEKSFDESFEFKDCTSSIWNKGSLNG